MDDIQSFVLKVRLSRLVDAIHECNAMDMGRSVDIRLDLWESVEQETKDAFNLLRVNSSDVWLRCLMDSAIDLTRCHDSNSGNEPSLSCYQRALDQFMDIVRDYPKDAPNLEATEGEEHF